MARIKEQLRARIVDATEEEQHCAAVKDMRTFAVARYKVQMGVEGLDTLARFALQEQNAELQNAINNARLAILLIDVLVD